MIIVETVCVGKTLCHVGDVCLNLANYFVSFYLPSDYGDGGYFLFDGDISDNILLATGGKFELTESTEVQPGTGQSIS